MESSRGDNNLWSQSVAKRGNGEHRLHNTPEEMATKGSQKMSSQQLIHDPIEPSMY